MTEAGELFVSLNGKDVGLATLLQRVDAQTQKSADSAARLQAQYARLAAAQGNTSLSSRILTSALTNNGGASERAVVSLSTQLATVQRGSTVFQEFGSAAKSSLLGIVGPAAIASGAIGGLIRVGESFKEAFVFTAQLDQTTASIAIQLKGIRDSGVAFAQAAAFADRYKLTQQETNAALQASVGILRNSTSSAEALLGVLARLQVASPEQGLEGAALAVKELQSGSITSLVGRFEVSRAAANKMKDAIAGGADAVTVLGKYLDDAGISMDALKARTEGAAGALNDATRAAERLKIAQGRLVQGPGTNITNAIAVGADDAANALGGGDGLNAALQNTSAGMAANAAAFIAFNAALIQTGSIEKAVAAAAVIRGNVYARNTTITGADAQATQQASDANDRHATSSLSAAAAAAQQAAAMQTDAAVSVADTAAKQAQTAVTALLEGQTRLAADAFLSLNPNISGSGLASAVASGQISAAVAQYIAMTLAAQQAKNQLAQLQAQAGISPALKAAATSYGGDVGRYMTRTDLASPSEGAANAARYREVQRQEQERAAAARSLALAQATSAGKVAIYQREYNEAVRIYGAQSTQALKAQTELVQIQEQKTKGAGGVKLSDQQKLDNQLIASQETYANKSEDLDTEHDARRLAILKKYQEDVAKEQADFAQSQLDTAAGFYDQMGGLTGKSAGKIQKQASADYEAAVTEAAQMGGEAGQRYLEAKEAAILARSKRASDIAEATEKGDAARAEYLKGVDAKYRAAEDAKIAAIAAGGDAATTERDKQLAEEDARYEEQGGKIALSADRAADARVAASERAGKAIDAEQAKLSGLETTYNRMGRGGTGVEGATAAESASSGITPGAAPAASAGALLGKLDELRAAIVAATSGGADRIVRSVDKIGRRGGVAE